MFMGALSAYVSMHHVHVVPTEARRRRWIPITGVADSCKPHVGA